MLDIQYDSPLMNVTKEDQITEADNDYSVNKPSQ